MNQQEERLTQVPSPHVLGVPVMTFQQVGDVLGISDNCVMHTERRALKKLREILIRRLGADFFGVL